MSNESFPYSSRLNHKSRITFWAIAVRIVLVFHWFPGQSIQSWISSPHLAAVIWDPTFTWEQVLQAKAIRGLSSSSSSSSSKNHAHHSKFRDAYRLPNQIHIPPLLLAALERLPFVSNPFWQDVLLTVFIVIVDYCIALVFERLAFRLLNGKTPEDEWEETLEPHIPEKIRPSLNHVFATTKVPPKMLENAKGEEAVRLPLILLEDLPLGLALLYFANPFTILSGSVLRCFRNLPLLALVLAVDSAIAASMVSTTKASKRQQQCTVLAALWLAVAAYLDVHNSLMIIPLALQLKGRRTYYSQQLVRMFVIYFLGLHVLSFLLVGPDLYGSVMRSTHLYSFQLARTHPSLSTLWYFGMELFDRFHTYFTVFLGGAPYLLVLPLMVRLHKYPPVLVRVVSVSDGRVSRVCALARPFGPSILSHLNVPMLSRTTNPHQFAIFWMLGVLFRPPGTLYQFVVGLVWMGLCPKSLVRLRPLVSLVALCAVPVPIVLLIVNLWLWLEPGSGEANFCFFQCLAYNVLIGILLVEFTSASLRRDKVLRLTEKLLATTMETTTCSSSSQPSSSEEGGGTGPSARNEGTTTPSVTNFTY